MTPSTRTGRRDFVKAAAGMASVPFAVELAAKATAPAISTASRPDNRIAEENSKPGTVEWQLQYTRFDEPITLASYPLNRRLRCSAIEGFCSKNSVLPADTIDIMVSLAPAGQFTIDIYRMGYYGGAGGRHMATLGPFKASPQPMPMMTLERLRECAWEKSTTLTIPKEWPSGVYLGKLTRDEDFGVQSYVVFVVKEHRKTDLLFQTSDLTWNAYNKWPGKNSMYDDGTPEVWYTGPHVRVSFDRPYAKYCQVVDAPGTISQHSGGTVGERPRLGRLVGLASLRPKRSAFGSAGLRFGQAHQTTTKAKQAQTKPTGHTHLERPIQQRCRFRKF